MEKTPATKEKRQVAKVVKPKAAITKKAAKVKDPVITTTEEQEIGDDASKSRYFQATGRRKTAVAVARLFTQGDKTFLINEKEYTKYFATKELQEKILAPLQIMNCVDRFKISINVSGGGLSSQAEASRHGIARALMLFNPTFRKRLKKAGFLTRDSRMRERKKFGLKRARRAPQWSKR